MELVFWKAIVWKKATNHNQAHSGIEQGRRYRVHEYTIVSP